jgi:hypothetical protein
VDTGRNLRDEFNSRKRKGKNMPTIEEKYQHMRANAEAFVKSMRALVASAAARGDEDLESNLKVWCLMPWEAAIRDDDSGDLWSLCEACGEPIKNYADKISSEECDFHSDCISSQ